MSEHVQAVPFAPARDFLPRGRRFKPTAREWVRHGALLLLTFISTTFAGVMIASEANVSDPVPSGFFGYFVSVPLYYLHTVADLVRQATNDPALLLSGLTFSTALLTILTAHEMGHYLACRYYGVDATLPFFIPAPPLFLAGTFGAFIKMRSPIPSRRALFDIGLAGPLAGFVVLLPIAVGGILLQTRQPHAAGIGGIVFNDPLLFQTIAKLSGTNLSADALPHPFWMAAWIGLLVTSLNLMPVGQLDGGHGTFSLFGQRAHKILGRLAFVAVATTSILGFIWHSSPSGFLYTVLLGVMLRVRHPAPQEAEPLGTARVVVAVLTLLVFVLSFVPFPITIT
ncbi:MAG TPA: site-2 protease family protein [Pyrinomonadaceae bacterium]|nr:site-2 protease family protein [Pyrinomonadaceae bacterium]